MVGSWLCFGLVAVDDYVVRLKMATVWCRLDTSVASLVHLSLNSAILCSSPMQWFLTLEQHSYNKGRQMILTVRKSLVQAWGDTRTTLMDPETALAFTQQGLIFPIDFSSLADTTMDLSVPRLLWHWLKGCCCLRVRGCYSCYTPSLLQLANACHFLH